jgi:cytosine/adenosine deaminase-related metal-dependent hydrolase
MAPTKEGHYLLKNGTVISMDPNVGILERGDVLIQGSYIQSVGKNLALEDGSATTVIDATDCIIFPGLVNNHHHMWQQLLRSLTTDWTLFDYLVWLRSIYGSLYTSQDVYIANYSAALDCINSGITTIIDHCHIMNSADHSDAAVKGLKDSQIRGTFCYGLYGNPSQDPAKPIFDRASREKDAKRVRTEHFPNNDPSTTVLTFGVAPDEVQAVPIDVVKRELEFSRSLGARIITSHVAMGRYDDGRQVVRQLGEANLLGPDCLFSHGASFTDEELAMIKSSGAAICATPETELQMGMGHPVAFRAQDAGCHVSLGIDITSNQSSDMFAQMRLALQAQRHKEHFESSAIPAMVARKSEEALYMATQGGANAIGLGHLVGSLTPGKKADVVVMRCDDINVVPVINPVGTLIYNSTPSNIDTVFIDGHLAKQGGNLVGVDWPSLRKEMRERSAALVAEAKKVDILPGVKAWKGLFGMSPDTKTLWDGSRSNL